MLQNIDKVGNLGWVGVLQGCLGTWIGIATHHLSGARLPIESSVDQPISDQIRLRPSLGDALYSALPHVVSRQQGADVQGQLGSVYLSELLRTSSTIWHRQEASSGQCSRIQRQHQQYACTTAASTPGHYRIWPSRLLLGLQVDETTAGRQGGHVRTAAIAVRPGQIWHST